VKTVVTGGSGFIGQPLVKRLVQRGHDVVVLSRNPGKVRAGRGAPWDAANAEIANADAVINLAGENVGDGRWTAERKRRILESRLEATRKVVEAMRATSAPPRTLISASAVGYYGVRGNETLDESASSGAGFLAEVTRRWEEQARAAESIARVVIPRFGVVLAGDGGALKKILLPFRLGLGGPIGNGKQWMSWIDRDDALRFIEWAIERPSVRGVYNATAPNPVTNREFARTLGRILHRPAIMPVPAFVLRLIFGEMADEVLLGGQRVVPARATAEGFTFSYPTLEGSLLRNR
jgi:uncharacterized protein (TIGR01777 family)